MIKRHIQYGLSKMLVRATACIFALLSGAVFAQDEGRSQSVERHYAFRERVMGANDARAHAMPSAGFGARGATMRAGHLQARPDMNNTRYFVTREQSFGRDLGARNASPDHFSKDVYARDDQNREPTMSRPMFSQGSGLAQSAGDRAQAERERAYSRERQDMNSQEASSVASAPLPSFQRNAEPVQRNDLSLKQAMEGVQEQTNGKILGAETMRVRGQDVHRIKVYTREGRVRVMQVPANRSLNRGLNTQPSQSKSE